MLEEEVVVGVLLDMKLADAVVEGGAQLVDVGALAGTDKEAVAIELCHPCALQVFEREVLACCGSEVVLVLGREGVGVYLIEDYHRRFFGTTEVGKGLIDDFYLLLEVRM